MIEMDNKQQQDIYIKIKIFDTKLFEFKQKHTQINVKTSFFICIFVKVVAFLPIKRKENLIPMP